MVFVGRPDLLRRFRQGESSALEAVYWAYVDQVTRVVQAVMNSYAAASGERLMLQSAELGDLVQEVFVRAFSPVCRSHYDGERPYGPYLVQIARNSVADHWRSARREVVLDVAPLLEALSLEMGSAVPARWADQETVAVVERYLGSLPPDIRRVHDALYVRGLSQREAAQILGMGRQAIRGIEAKLRAGVQRELQRTGQMTDEKSPLASPSAVARRASAGSGTR
jgi:RNA polymerase sigma factor (sigma-70 family)